MLLTHSCNAFLKEFIKTVFMEIVFFSGILRNNNMKILFICWSWLDYILVFQLYHVICHFIVIFCMTTSNNKKLPQIIKTEGPFKIKENIAFSDFV